MSEIVIINGPPGVGKTTVVRLLADLMPGAVCIRGDELRAFAPADARDHLGGGSTYRAAAALSAAYLAMGAPRVVFDYVFSRLSHLRHFLDALDHAAQTPVFMFTLWGPLDVVRSRERERAGRLPLVGAVEECWNEIAVNKAALGHFIDNSAVAAEETARTISDLIAKREGRLDGGSVRGAAGQAVAADGAAAGPLE
jgi:predicted kinase